MISELLEKRKLPALKSREEMLDILQKEEYGYLPGKPVSMTWDVKENCISHFCAGKASASKVTLNCKLTQGDFSFPIYCSLPTDGKKHPFFIHVNFRPDVPDRYMPVEELIDEGFAVISFCYADVTSDDGDFTNGLAGVLYKDGARGPTDAGKIAMWAWAAQRALDYAETLDDVLDPDGAVVCGHSRLGKTALLSAATDERFAFGYSNDSGCSGAAITRDKQGERVADICKRFPYWFCENYYKYIGREHGMPFDQHYLIASVAPRCALIGSASEDIWADPESEFLACAAASSAFKKGLVSEDRLPEIGEAFLESDIGYHLRKGLHYFSRDDWHRLIEFINKKRS